MAKAAKKPAKVQRCKFCRKQFATPLELAKHIRSKHAAKVKLPSPNQMAMIADMWDAGVALPQIASRLELPEPLVKKAASEIRKHTGRCPRRDRWADLARSVVAEKKDE